MTPSLSAPRPSRRWLVALLAVACLPLANTAAAAADTALGTSATTSTPGLLVDEAFERVVTKGLGNSGMSGAWMLNGPGALFNVNGGSALLSQSAPGQGIGANLPAASGSDLLARVKLSANKPQTGGGTYASTVLRYVSPSTDYRVRLRLLADSRVVAQIMRRSGGVESVLAAKAVPGLVYTPGKPINLSSRVSGQSPTSLSVKAWAAGSPEPSTWFLTAKDATPGLQVQGSIGLHVYLSASATSAPQSVRFDDLVVTTPAVKVFGGPEEGAVTTSTTASMSFTSSRTPTSFDCSSNGGAWAACTSPTTLSSLPDGPHSLLVRGRETSGLLTPVVARRWIVDTRGPLATVAFASPVGLSSGSVTSSTASAFILNADEKSTFQCSLDGATPTACTNNPDYVGLTDGSHSLSVTAGDSAGNTGPATSVQWTVDTSAPTTSITTGPAGETTATAAAFTFAAGEPGTAQCRLDSLAWTGCSSPASYSGLGVGTHNFTVRSTDAAGNTTATPASRTWTIVAPAAVPVVMAGQPGPSNTGVPVGTRLTPYYGNLTITQPGATYDALDIHGFVTIKAPNVKITRSIIRGGKATGNIGLVTNYDPTATGFVLEDSELVPEFPSVWIDGIKGANYTIRRVNSHGTNDNVKVHGDNVTVDSSWLHDTVYRLQDPNLGNTPTHNDAVQVLGGKNIRVLRSTLQEAHNAGVQVTQDYRATTDLVIAGNWIDGGGCSVNLAHKKLTSMTGITVTNNRFGRNQRLSDCAIISSSGTTLTHSGNVWNDNNTAVRISNGG